MSSDPRGRLAFDASAVRLNLQDFVHIPVEKYNEVMATLRKCEDLLRELQGSSVETGTHAAVKPGTFV